MLDETEILKQLKAGDQSVMKKLFDRHHKALCQTAFALLNDRAAMDDVVQSVFIKLWQKKESINIEQSLAIYLKGMTIKESISFIRGKKSFEDESQLVQYAVQPLYHSHTRSSEEIKEQIQLAVQNLPPKCQLVFKLSKYEGLSYKEIANFLNISVKTVENQMGKALKMLRIALSSKGA